jgi:hypothetical protein
MFKIIKQVAQVFKSNGANSLEQYINSKNPQTNADVDQLTREYQTQPETWARGL